MSYLLYVNVDDENGQIFSSQLKAEQYAANTYFNGSMADLYDAEVYTSPYQSTFFKLSETDKLFIKSI